MKKIKTKFYRKLIINYNIIIISIIIGFNFTIIQELKTQKLDYMEKNNQKMITTIQEFIEDTNDSIDNFISELYKDNSKINDTIFFINNEFNDYLERKFNIYTNSTLTYYNGIENSIKSLLSTEIKISNVDVVSYKMKRVYSFDRGGGLATQKLSAEDIVALQERKKYKKSQEVVFLKNIRNPENLNVEGIILFKMDKVELDKKIEGYTYQHRAIITGNDGSVIYDTKIINRSNQKLQKYDIVNLTQIENINMMEVGNIKIAGIYKYDSFTNDDKRIGINLISINILFFCISQIFIFKRFSNLNKRLNLIIGTMEDINITKKLKRIPEYLANEKDELSLICTNFNEMCIILERHIEKDYISKLNQKNAEMKALQSSVNPHFLYNVLETIRMKAIINNDKEVGRMIYLLANLFRQQLKEKNFITIQSELDYCNKFLEIYKFRYTDKINYTVSCDEDVLHRNVIKFIIQPIIENYFVHGIRLEDNDNKISINIKKNVETIVIEIEDNGRGIEQHKLEKLRLKIFNKENDSQQIGILNVNERIRIKYGDEYGLQIFSKIGIGTKIIITLPY